MHASEDVNPYLFREWAIPSHMMAAIRRYIEYGIKPGDFLTAIICNDFQDAVGRADDENIRNLPAYAAYLYSEAPTECHGSPEKMRAWISAKRGDTKEVPYA